MAENNANEEFNLIGADDATDAKIKLHIYASAVSPKLASRMNESPPIRVRTRQGFGTP